MIPRRRPPPPAPEGGGEPAEVPEWRRAAARMRRLQIAQLGVLLLMGGVITAAAVTVAHAVAGMETRSTRASAALYELGEARDGLRSVESDFWRLRTPGRPVPVTVDAIREVAEARDRLTGVLGTQRETLGADSLTIAAGERTIRRLDAVIAAIAAGSGLQAGTPGEDLALARLIPRIVALDTTIGAWSAATSREQARVEAELSAGRRRLVTLALAVVVVFGLGGVAVWALLDRAGRRVVSALVEATDEQRALRRVATSVMRGEDLEETLAIVAREVGPLSGAAVAEVVRAQAGAAPVAVWCAPGRRPLGAAGLGTMSAMRRPQDDSARPRVRVLAGADAAGDRALAEAGLGAAAAVPVIAAGRLWGAIGLAFTGGDVPHATLDRVERFAEQAAVVVEQAHIRRLLADQAATDHLTSLPNHRSFHERLTAEAAAAAESGGALSLALFDLDDFRTVNEGLGHQTGDRVIAEVARRLRAVAADGDLVARIGGEEFAWIMPGTPAMGAFAAAERARLLIRERPLAPGVSLTVSAGVCDLGRAGDAASLVRLTDGALYWAKHNGRDLACIYSPETVREISDAERADRLERLRSLEGLRALARAVDARDPYTQRHSERVALLARRLAIALGWSEPRADALREAGLVHDVGKIGVPDSILLKPAALDEAEFAQIRRHAELGAQIVADVLSPEAASWVRGHHERPDGGGYPDGLAGDAIPEGARILALADAWDAMTTDRPYRRGTGAPEALAECRRCAGTQLWAPAVDALEALIASGVPELDPQPPGTAGRSPGWIRPVS
ncbi:MAG: diguanylate cyclase [Thermoleophilia bacterium]|nr:diguanylate cyclase [Thermoleophilia bacterium]